MIRAPVMFGRTCVNVSADTALVAFVGKLQRSTPLSPADRAALLGLRNSVRSLRKGDFIVREDEVPRYCCVLTAGFAIRHKASGGGGRQIFSIHMRGDAIDLHNSLLNRADHNLQMLSHGEAAFIPVEAIRELTLERPAIGQALWRETLIDSAIFREWTLNIGRRDARCRMAHMLCEFALRLEVVGLGEQTHYELPMTQEELADAVALTPIHVSRTLKALAQEGFVERRVRSVRIIDWHRLAKLGDFESSYLHLEPNA
jgi:CRP-like cAMP-binding protein